MVQRINAEFGLVDGMTAELGGPRRADLLQRLNAAIPWDDLARPILKLAPYQGQKRSEPGKAGRRAWPVVTMLKCQMLAKWFGLSDNQLKECLMDRLSFRRFVGLSLTEATPDATTFVVFRRRLRDAELDQKLFDLTVRTLDERGLMVNDGTLVEATIIEQARGTKREDGSSTRDSDAIFMRKGGETFHGYKGHIAASRRGLVKDFRFSDAVPP